MKNPCQIFVEHELGAVSDSQLVEWACEILSSDSPLADDPAVAELAGLRLQLQSDLELADRLFRSIIRKHFPDFAFKSPDGVRWAREALKRRCEDYLQLRITPYEFCSIVFPIEQHYDFPKWLGGLFSACDLVECHTKREDEPYLEAEARKLYDAA
jgi:hypothetical protein